MLQKKIFGVRSVLLIEVFLFIYILTLNSSLPPHSHSGGHKFCGKRFTGKDHLNRQYIKGYT